ncbi:hypothetical protein, partial [Chlorogloea sp. CCALA 695]|uniref:hypothetical protein n=1 Tax=Chlorogloea sp. CCALA 695 TaxID=2107693 RepID=UPI001E3677EA
IGGRVASPKPPAKCLSMMRWRGFEVVVFLVFIFILTSCEALRSPYPYFSGVKIKEIIVV